MDIVLTVLSAALQGLLAFWGFKLSTGPLETPQQHQFYKRGFIIVGILGVGITAFQALSNSREQGELNAAITKLTEGVGKVEEQTKQPANVIVNVPPAQVIVSQASGGPLPSYRLTGYDYPLGMNDPVWRQLAGQRVRIDWRQMDGIDAYAELFVWPKECGTAQARIFDETTNSVAVEGAPVTVWSKSEPFNIFDCKPQPQRLKLPRDKAAHTYHLEAIAGGGAYATAIGEIVLERIPSPPQPSVSSELSTRLLVGSKLLGDVETAEPGKFARDARNWRDDVLQLLRGRGLAAEAAIFESRSIPPLPRLVAPGNAANRQTWNDLVIDTTNLRNLISELRR
jgi:hypothetical protein